MTYEERKRLLCQQCDRQHQCGYANRDLQDKCTALQEKMEGWELGHADAIDNPTGGELLHVLNKGRKIGYKDATERAVEFIYAQQLAVQNIEELINELKKFIEEGVTMKEAYEYAANRLTDPDCPKYNDETEIVDAYEQGYKDAVDKASKWLIERYENQGVILLEDIHELNEKMEE